MGLTLNGKTGGAADGDMTHFALKDKKGGEEEGSAKKGEKGTTWKREIVERNVGLGSETRLSANVFPQEEGREGGRRKKTLKPKGKDQKVC